MSEVEKRALSEIAVLQAGVGFPLEMQGRSNGKYPLAKVGDISRCARGKYDTLDAADHFVDEIDLVRLRTAPIPAGSILFAKIGEAIRQNHRVIAGRPLLIDNNAMAAVPGPATTSRYLYHFLRTVDFYPLASATTVPSLRKSDLLRIQVPLPSLAEQERIAGILDKADGVRRKREEALKLSDELLRSVFLEMFGDPVTNPKGWPVRALKVLGRVTTGTTPPSAEEGMFDGNIPFITPGDLKETWVKTSRTVTEKGALKARTISKGATLVCCIGATIGKMGKAAQLSAFNQQINAIEWGEQVNADYGLETLKFFKKAIAQRGSATTLPILNKSAFQQLEIPVASEVNQRQFSEVVEVIDQMRTNATETLFQTQSLFSSLQQRVFSGQL